LPLNRITEGTSAGLFEKNFLKYQMKNAMLHPTTITITIPARIMCIVWLYTAARMHCTITASVYKGAMTAIRATIDHCKLIFFILPSTRIAFFLSFPKNTTIVNRNAAMRKGNQRS